MAEAEIPHISASVDRSEGQLEPSIKSVIHKYKSEWKIQDMLTQVC